METNLLPLSDADARSEYRTVLRVNATLYCKEAAPQNGKTIDMGVQGISLLMPESTVPGTVCGIRFTAMVNGQIVKVEAMAKVVYSICVGTSGFRTGCQFTDMEAASKAAVERIIGKRAAA